jgi:hypothetical protein
MTEVPRKRQKRRLLLIGCALLPFGFCSGMIGGCIARLPARPTGLQKTVINAEGEPVELTLWSAKRVVRLSFFDGDSAYVYCGNSRCCIHDGEFGDGVGDVLVSPDHSQAFVEHSFEGGITNGVLIDLRTRKMRQCSLFSDDLNVRHWERHRWRTRFELLERKRLYDSLRSGIAQDARTAVQELEIRGFEDQDWRVIASAFADQRLPGDCRHYLGWTLVYGRKPQRYSELAARCVGLLDSPAGQGPLLSASSLIPGIASVHRRDVITLVATVLDDEDPYAQLSAAWVLSEIVPDAPGKVDIVWGYGGEELFWKRHREAVPLFQNWWKARRGRGQAERDLPRGGQARIP